MGSVVHQREVCVHPRCTHTFPFDMPTLHVLMETFAVFLADTADRRCRVVT